MSRTQRAALRSILGIRKTLQWKVYSAIEGADPRGLTIDELVVLFDRVSTQARVTELHQLGLIYRTRRTRLSRASREVSVYRVRKFPKPMERHTCPLCGSKISRKQAGKVHRVGA